MHDTAPAMLDAHPVGDAGRLREALLACIEATYTCAQACTVCADACLGEDAPQELVACIRSDLDCADVCEATGRVVSRRTGGDHGVLRAQLEACAAACRACAEECERHADHHEHCRVCAEACRRCEEACHALLRELSIPADHD